MPMSKKASHADLCPAMIWIELKMVSERRINEIIKEELTRAEVNSMIDSKLSSYNSDKDLKRTIRAVAADVLDDLFHELWRKSGFWKAPIKNR